MIHAAVHEHRIGPLVGPTAAGMSEQMFERDLLDVRMIRRPSMVDSGNGARAEDSVVQTDAARFDEREDRNRGDRFGDAVLECECRM
jgi:hypothetical protein